MNEVRFSIGKVMILFLRCGNVNVVAVINVVIVVNAIVVVVIIIVGNVGLAADNESKGVS